MCNKRRSGAVIDARPIDAAVAATAQGKPSAAKIVTDSGGGKACYAVWALGSQNSSSGSGEKYNRVRLQYFCSVVVVTCCT